MENIGSLFNDKYRLDNVLDSVSVSISFPNYKMLYSLRMQNPNADWAILKIDPSVLWEANCAFCFTNAAATPVASIPLEQRRNMESLKQMFAETQGQQSRRNLRIPENFPTDPQAEVLLLESIPPRYITSISVNNPSTLANLRKIINVNHPDRNNISIFCDKTLFSPRVDHEYWSKNAQKPNSIE